jgi:hypothetical protein
MTEEKRAQRQRQRTELEGVLGPSFPRTNLLTGVEGWMRFVELPPNRLVAGARRAPKHGIKFNATSMATSSRTFKPILQVGLKNSQGGLTQLVCSIVEHLA